MNKALFFKKEATDYESLNAAFLDGWEINRDYNTGKGTLFILYKYERNNNPTLTLPTGIQYEEGAVTNTYNFTTTDTLNIR